MRSSDWSSDVCASDLQPGLDVFKQGFQPRPFERSAGIPAVVVTFAHANPALSALAGDIGLAGLALGIEAVELHVQPFFAGFSGLDGAQHAQTGRATCRERSWCTYRWSPAPSKT